MGFKQKLAGFTAAILLGIKVVDFVLGWLGNMDLVVERINNPGWIGLAINFLFFDPPAWFSNGLLFVALILLAYVSFSLKRGSEEPSKETLTPKKILKEQRLLHKQQLRERELDSQNKKEPTPILLPQSEIEKRIGVLDSIHDVLTGSAKEAYEFGHQLRNSWNTKVVNEGPQNYIKQVLEFKEKVSDSTQEIDAIIRQYSYYDDIEKMLRDLFQFQAEVYPPIDEFIQALGQLPDNPENNTVMLIIDKYENFSKSVARFNHWIEETKELLKITTPIRITQPNYIY